MDALLTMLVLQEQANYLEVVFLNLLVGVVLEHQESVRIVTKFYLVENQINLKDFKDLEDQRVMASVHMTASLMVGVGRCM